MDRINLQDASFGKDEINEAVDSLRSTQVVMGSKCRNFETKWSKWQNIKNSVFVNSGSSANLLIISLLKSKRASYQLKNGDEILVPAVTWSTTLAPIIQLGLKPVLVDVDPKTFNISIDSCQKVLTPKTKGIFAVHLLGNPVHLDQIRDFCQTHNLLLLEDACEAIGAKWNKIKVGNFGVASSFSFMFAHHMTTIEGGMICTQNKDDANVIKANRAHGWIREFDKSSKNKIIKSEKPRNDKFYFWDMGYNLRPTEINASFGIHQLNKIDHFIRIRKRNFELYMNELKKFENSIQFQELEDVNKSERSNFAFGFYFKDPSFIREDFLNYLDRNHIESRPLVAGNLLRNGFFSLYCDNSSYPVQLPVADLIHDNGLYLPNHQNLSEKDIKYITQTIIKYMKDNN